MPAARWRQRLTCARFMVAIHGTKLIEAAHEPIDGSGGAKNGAPAPKSPDSESGLARCPQVVSVRQNLEWAGAPALFARHLVLVPGHRSCRAHDETALGANPAGTSARRLRALSGQ